MKLRKTKTKGVTKTLRQTYTKSFEKDSVRLLVNTGDLEYIAIYKSYGSVTFTLQEWEIFLDVLQMYLEDKQMHEEQANVSK